MPPAEVFWFYKQELEDEAAARLNAVNDLGVLLTLGFTSSDKPEGQKSRRSAENYMSVLRKAAGVSLNTEAPPQLDDEEDEDE